MIEELLKSIKANKIDILMLERDKEKACEPFNSQIKELTELIGHLEAGLEQELIDSGEKKIETKLGNTTFKKQQDKWYYDDFKIIDWCKLNGYGYYHVVEILDKLKLKKAIQDKTVKAPREGLTITPQDDKFSYTIKGGII